MYIEGWLQNQLYLHNFACDVLVLCKESLRLERTLKTIKSNQHPISFLHSLSRWPRAAGWWWQQCLLPCLSTHIKSRGHLSLLWYFFKPVYAGRDQGRDFCLGRNWKEVNLYKYHNEICHCLEECCDTDIAVQYRGVTMINGKIFPPHFLLQVRARPDKTGISQMWLDCSSSLTTIEKQIVTGHSLADSFHTRNKTQFYGVEITKNLIWISVTTILKEFVPHCLNATGVNIHKAWKWPCNWVFHISESTAISFW